jgi:signal transduction histidine kinase
VQRARARASELLDSEAFGPGGTGAATIGFAIELLVPRVPELAASPTPATHLLERLEQEASIPRLAIGRQLLSTLRLPGIEPEQALQTRLRLLLLFTGAATASIWRYSLAGEPLLRARAGDPDGEMSPPSELATSVTLPVVDGERTLLAVTDGAGSVLQSRLLLDAAAMPLAATLAHADRARTNEPAATKAINTMAHRLARIRFDLHDGPQQDLQLLGIDLKLFRDQLSQRLGQVRDGSKLLARIDDLEAQLVALDSDLRQISHSLQSPFLPEGTLADAIGDVVRAFAHRAEIEPRLELSGDFAALSDSQQITVLALIREALSNVREHSEAARVDISVAADDRGLEVRVVDDGRGFDPESTLISAGRAGHLGVVGIYERVRMLGGTANIQSRPGGPTVVSAWIPAWKAGASA